jgi:hypothetical protein
MPNWCSNQVTLTGPKEKIDQLIVELQKSDDINTPYEILNVLRPRPADQEEDWYSWNVSNWGTKWDVNIGGYEIIDENTVSFTFDSAWSPPTALYDFLQEEGWTVDGYYYEPGIGYCGHYEDGFDDYYEYGGKSADEVAEMIPSDLDEMFMIVEDMRQWEEENEEND